MTALNPGLSRETELIQRRRRQCIVHRILYYCFDTNIIPDAQYDRWEGELRQLVKDYPEDAEKACWKEWCPVNHVGSSEIDTYPEILVYQAKMLLRVEEEQAGFRLPRRNETPPPKPKKQPKPEPKVKNKSLFSFLKT